MTAGQMRTDDLRDERLNVKRNFKMAINDMSPSEGLREPERQTGSV